jgi:hypothetical protein
MSIAIDSASGRVAAASGLRGSEYLALLGGDALGHNSATGLKIPPVALYYDREKLALLEAAGQAGIQQASHVENVRRNELSAARNSTALPRSMSRRPMCRQSTWSVTFHNSKALKNPV